MAPTIDDYIDICKINANNRDKWDKDWEENNVSNQLAYFFQDENIFKSFLEKIIEKPIYCSDNKNKELIISKDIIKTLEFEEMRFPQTRVCINTDCGKKEIDILLKGKNFLCVIENKFGSSEHNQQCQYYKKYTLDKCRKENKIPICIYIDSENSSKKITENKFRKDKQYSGYYLAWYGKDILPVLENKNHEILGNNIKKFCNFLKEVTWSSYPEIQKEKTKRRTKVKKCIEELLPNDTIKCYYDEICINGKCFLQRHQYLEYSRKETEELKKYLKQELKNFSKKYKIKFKNK